MRIQMIEAHTIGDLWFQAIYNLNESARARYIDQGSFAGQTRYEYDYLFARVKKPHWEPILPEIPQHFGIPNPVDPNYVYGGKEYSRSYIEYLMTDRKEPHEEYTYGARLTHVPIPEISIPLNQIETVISVYQKYGYGTNQMILQIAQPSDLFLEDPPCLRHIDTRIMASETGVNQLHFFAYFRSWDLWAGLPANLAAIVTLQEYMAGEIGVEVGEMIVESKGAHIYDYAQNIARIRCGWQNGWEAPF